MFVLENKSTREFWIGKTTTSKDISWAKHLKTREEAEWHANRLNSEFPMHFNFVVVEE